SRCWGVWFVFRENRSPNWASFWIIGRSTRSLNGCSSSISSSERGRSANWDRRMATASRPIRGTMKPMRTSPSAPTSRRARSIATLHLDVHDLLDHHEAEHDADGPSNWQEQIGEAREHRAHVGGA